MKLLGYGAFQGSVQLSGTGRYRLSASGEVSLYSGDASLEWMGAPLIKFPFPGSIAHEAGPGQHLYWTYQCDVLFDDTTTSSYFQRIDLFEENTQGPVRVRASDSNSGTLEMTPANLQLFAKNLTLIYLTPDPPDDDPQLLLNDRITLRTCTIEYAPTVPTS